VWGLGGAGKTQLVLDYVQQHRNEYTATFWIEAGRKESLERDFVRLYQTLFGLHASAESETAISVEDAVTGVKSWFASQRGPWLVVFDGADAIEDQEADGYINIRHFIPSTATLDVIITSRSSTAEGMTRLEGVQVGEMEAGQAVKLFQKYARLSHHDATTGDEVLCIVKELGCLALAVTLAATYVGSTPRLQGNIKAYLPEYRQRRWEVLRRKPVSLVHQYSESVLTTWETSYAAVASQSSEASVLMTMLSFLSFDDIYLDLFCIDAVQDSVEQAGKSSLSWRRLVSPQQPVDVYMIEGCFAVLQKYSLVQWKAEQRGYAMHKLVHAWGHDRLTAEEQSKYSRTVFGLVVEAVEAVGSYGRGLKDKLRLVPHVMGSFQALVGATDSANCVLEGVTDEMEEIGGFMTDHGRWPETRAVEEYVLQARSGLLGAEHPSTITAMSNLASTLGEQGYLEEAAEMEKEVLEKMRRILGEEHPSTISAMNNLASTLGQQGQLDEAAAMTKEVLEKRRRILGEEHPDTITHRRSEMSGAEAVAAIQLIDACIGIADTIINIGRAVYDAQGLPPKLRELLEKLPAIQDLLESTQESCEEGRITEDASKNAQPILKQCEEALAELRDIFRKACPKDGEKRTKRIWRGTKTIFFGRDSQVQKLLITIQDDLRLLEQKEIYVIGDKLDALQQVTEALADNEDGKYTHTGGGNIIANEGGSPTNYVVGGGYNRPTSSDSTILDGGTIATIAPLGAPLLPVTTGSASRASSVGLSSLVLKVEPLQPEIESPVPAQASNARLDTPSFPAPQISATSSLCSTIRANDANAVRLELGDGNERLREPCPGTGTYPIHCALKYRAYNALAVLLEKADRDIMDLECGGRTALEMACEDGGRSEAFRCFQRYHTCLKFPEDVYKEYRNELGTDARKAFMELYDMINSGKKKKKKSWTFGSRK
jgi:tetratricopeptide (TPR) repeat protein